MGTLHEEVAKEDGCRLLTVNCTGWSSAQDLIAGPLLKQARVKVLFLQEHHLTATDTLADAKQWASSRGWDSHWSAAVATEGGSSGGVAVLARKELGMARAPETGVVIEEGRAVSGYIPSFRRGGLTVVSCYLRHSVGWDADNAATCRAVAQHLGGCPGEWIWGGDFNMEPSTLNHEGWLHKMGAVVAAPTRPTCWASDEGSKIDYFVFSSELAHSIPEVTVMEDTGIQTHSPVALSLATSPRPLWTRQLVQPAALPALRHGCSRKPMVWAKATRLVDEAACEESLGRAWAEVLHLIEGELLRRMDLVGAEAVQYKGRGGFIGFKWRQLLPANDSHFVHRMDDKARAWQVAKVWATNLRSRLRRLRQLGNQEGPRTPAVVRKIAAIAKEVFGIKGAATRDSRTLDAIGAEARGLFEGDIPLDWWQRTRSILEEARRQAERCKREGVRKWQQWAREAMEGGASKAHRYTKAVQYQEAWEASRSKCGGLLSDPFALADREWAAWKEVWSYHEDTSPQIIPRVGSGEDRLPPMTPALMDSALAKFREGTATGQDLLPPRLMLQLSQAGKWAVCRLLGKCEELEQWPDSRRIMHVMVGLPKPEGGCRLIALMPTLLRLWGRMRLEVARSWEAANAHPAFWGEAGRSSSGSAFSMLARAEAAQLTGGDAVAILFDLWKAYEAVHHATLLKEAAEVGYPVRLVSMALRAYRLPRGLRMFGGYASSLLVVDQGILAGCSLAKSLLKALMLRKVRILAARHPRVQVRILMDDLSLQRAVAANRVKGTWDLVPAAQDTIQMFDDLDLVAQPAKCGYVCTSTRALRVVRGGLSALGLEPKQWMRNLGHELPGSVAKEARTMEKRRLQQVVGPRRRRILKLSRVVGRQSISRILTAGIHPAWLHTAGTTGCSDQALGTMRSFTAAAIGVERSESATMAMWLEKGGLDPIYRASLPLLFAYCEMVWTSAMPLRTLKEAVAALGLRQAAVGAHSLRWAAVRGPLLATKLTLERLGWRLKSATTWQDDLGQQHSLLERAPRWMQSRIVDSIGRWQHKRIEARLGYGDVDWDLLQQLYRGQGGKELAWCSGAATLGALRKLLVGGLWTRQRLCAKGWAVGELCAGCGREIDTPSHRWWKCQCTAALREHNAEAAALAQRVPPLVLYGTLFSYALPMVYPGLLPQPVSEEEVHFAGEAHEGYIWQGEVFVDGSGYQPRWAVLRRCGWAAIQLNDDGSLKAAMYGPLPGEDQTVPTAEHFALLQVVRRGGTHIRIWSDCQAVVGNFEKGAGAMAAGKYFAGLWKQVFSAMGAETQLEVRKVKAHTTQQHPEGSEEWRLQTGNRFADDKAKEGAQVHALAEDWVEDWLQQRRHNLMVQEHVVSCFMAGLEGKWWLSEEDAALRRDERMAIAGARLATAANEPEAVPQPQPEVLEVERHRLEATAEGWQCLDCRRYARTAGHRLSLQQRPCRPLSGVAAHPTHTIAVGPTGIVFCRFCGAFANRLARHILKVCPPHCSRGGKEALRELLAGRIPRTGGKELASEAAKARRAERRSRLQADRVQQALLVEKQEPVCRQMPPRVFPVPPQPPPQVAAPQQEVTAEVGHGCA